MVFISRLREKTNWTKGNGWRNVVSCHSLSLDRMIEVDASQPRNTAGNYRFIDEAFGFAANCNASAAP